MWSRRTREGLTQYGKQHQRPVPGKTASVVKDRVGVLRNGDLLPGQQISMDHFICKTKGRLFTSAGKSLRQDMFSGGCLFIDHASSFVHVEFQVHLNTAESLEAKDKFARIVSAYLTVATVPTVPPFTAHS